MSYLIFGGIAPLRRETRERGMGLVKSTSVNLECLPLALRVGMKT